MKLYVFKLGLQSSVAHNIAQNLNANPEFNIEEYLEECWQVFAAAGIKDDIIAETLDVAVEQAKMEYAIGTISMYGSAQLRPEVSYEYAMQMYRDITSK